MDGLQSRTYIDLFAWVKSGLPLRQRHRIKVMLGDLAVNAFSLGKCPSAYKYETYEPFSMRMEKQLMEM